MNITGNAFKKHVLYCFVGVSTAAALLLKKSNVFLFKKSLCSTTEDASYRQLSERLKEIEKLNGIISLLSWDEQVMMSPGSASARYNAIILYRNNLIHFLLRSEMTRKALLRA